MHTERDYRNSRGLSNKTIKTFENFDRWARSCRQDTG